MFSVLNQSTLVTDEELALAVGACAHQITYHAAPKWGMRSVPVHFRKNPNQISNSTWTIIVYDDADQADALGWHTEENGMIFGRVFARPIYDNGGSAWDKPLSVASVLSHELLETYVDPHVNLWADDGAGSLYAVEVGDPVESDSYRMPYCGKQVYVSNFVLPAWFDPQAAPGHMFDYMDNVSRPFTMDSGGYVVTMKEGKVSQQFGEHYPEWRKGTDHDDIKEQLPAAALGLVPDISSRDEHYSVRTAARLGQITRRVVQYGEDGIPLTAGNLSKTQYGPTETRKK